MPLYIFGGSRDLVSQVISILMGAIGHYDYEYSYRNNNPGY